jgi:hypothetical protein
MPPLRIFTDEDVYGTVAISLRSAGFDAVSTPEVGRRGESDESQLAWATAEHRAIVTFNVGHFARLHTQWMQKGQSHTGIIVSSQRPVGDLLRRLVQLAKALDADAMCNRLEFLSDW